MDFNIFYSTFKLKDHSEMLQSATETATELLVNKLKNKKEIL